MGAAKLKEVVQFEPDDGSYESAGVVVVHWDDDDKAPLEISGDLRYRYDHQSGSYEFLQKQDSEYAHFLINKHHVCYIEVTKSELARQVI